MYADGFRLEIDIRNPTFFKSFDFILNCQKELSQISLRLAKICVKLGKTEAHIAEEMYHLNAGRDSIS